MRYTFSNINGTPSLFIEASPLDKSDVDSISKLYKLCISHYPNATLQCIEATYAPMRGVASSSLEKKIQLIVPFWKESDHRKLCALPFLAPLPPSFDKLQLRRSPLKEYVWDTPSYDAESDSIKWRPRINPNRKGPFWKPKKEDAGAPTSDKPPSPDPSLPS